MEEEDLRNMREHLMAQYVDFGLYVLCTWLVVFEGQCTPRLLTMVGKESPIAEQDSVLSNS